MKAVISIFFLALFSASQLAAQTKLIAHKSHGGSDSDFQKALENDEVLLNSNLGLTPMMIFMQLRLDSVVKVNDSTTIIVMKRVYGDRSIGFTYPDRDCLFDLERYSKENLHRAGQYTLVNHPIFSQDITADELRTELDSSGCFGYASKNVTINGYQLTKEIQEDSKKRRRKDKGSFIVPIVDFYDPLTGLFLLALTAGLIFFRLQKQRNLHAITLRK